MPKEYIVRLLFDRRHISLAIKQHNYIIGGICYRPYKEQRFVEIAFCAINSSVQVRGYGSKLMNALKVIAQRERKNITIYSYFYYLLFFFSFIFYFEMFLPSFLMIFYLHLKLVNIIRIHL
jgi:hypothetical protein